MNQQDEIAKLRCQLAFWRLVAMCLASILLLACASAFGEDLRITQLQAEHDAIAAAIDDANDYHDPRSLRYIWLQETSEPRIAGVQFVVNAVVSRSAHPVGCRVLAGGHLVALDFRALLPSQKDLLEVGLIWEKLANLDFFFHDQNQRDVVVVEAGAEVVIVSENAVIFDGSRQIGKVFKGWSWTCNEIRGDWYAVTHGKFNGWVHKSHVQRKVISTKESRAPFAFTIAEQMATLAELCGSAAPIIRAEAFVAKCFTTFNDGLLYEFVGVEGKTLDEVLVQFGAEIKRIEDLGSDSWAAVSRSGVTENPRAWAAVPMLSPSATAGTRLAMLTFDLNNENIDQKVDPILNIWLTLFQLKFDGGEGVLQRKNGFPFGCLYDGRRKLVDVVPQNIATDPGDETAHRELRPNTSCNRCHDKVWYKDSGNNIRWLALNGGPNLGDLIADINQLKINKTPEEIWSDVSQKYMGDLSSVLEDSRRVMARQIFRGCGQPAEVAMAGVNELYAAYEYGEYTPSRVLRWLGYEISTDGVDADGEPLKLTPLQQRQAFQKICPPQPGREDPGIIGLRLWEPGNPNSLHMGARAFERVFTTLSYLRDKKNDAEQK